MKPKKKTPVTTKKTSKKLVPSKPIMLIDKTIATTKEKTHNTIQDPVQTKEPHTFIHSARNQPTRISYMEKLEEYNLSPFSSPGGSSVSPRYRKTVSPGVKEEKEKKKCKSKPLLQNQKCGDKRKVEIQKRQGKNKPKMTKEQCNFAYQNFLLKKLNQKKITQLSEQSSASISKVNKLNLNIRIPKQKKQFSLVKTKVERIRQLRQKITEKYRKDLPSLKTYQLKFFCSIVMIQRLWRQQKIKNFITQFISPRNSHECNFTSDSHRQTNLSKLDTTGNIQEQTSELIRKYHNLSFSYDKKNQSIQQQARSTQVQFTLRNANLKDLQLSSQLTPQKQKRMVKFVECLRDIKFSKPTNKISKQTKMNVFNLQESLSQKCLMQTFYQKLFKNSPTKMNNFQMFNCKKEQKNLQRSIQLINTMKSPQKVDLIEIQQRFQTQLQSQETIVVKPLVQTAEISVETDRSFLQDSNKEVKSLKQLNFMSQEIIFILLNDFCEQFHAFTGRSVLRKKKQASLPGLKVSKNTIKQYLIGLTSHMIQNYDSQVIRRFSLINPLNFLKIHHEYQDEDQYLDEQEDQLNIPIIPNTLFYQYQLIYQSQKFIIRQQDKKFSNFLQSLIKINNLLLANCLSEMLEKSRIERVILPWDNKFDANRNKKIKFTKNNLENELSKIIDSICCSAFMRVGQFHKKLDDFTEQQKLLKSIHMEYQSQGNQWSAQYQYLQLRMDLTKHVEEIILQEVMRELVIFF